MANIAASNVPPVPNEHSILSVPDSAVDKDNYTITLSRINNVWTKWFMDLRTKVNVINNSTISLANITSPGTIVTDGNGNFSSVHLAPGTYGDATHVAQVTVGPLGDITNITNVAITASGTVTSVGLAAPSQFTVSGSPVTTSGTLAFAWNTQTANTVLAGPATGAAAAPTFRALVAADITGAALTSTNDTNVTITLGGTPATALLHAASITMGWTGQLAVARGGTGVATANANTLFAGPVSGAAAAPSFRTAVLNDTAWPSDYISGLKLIWNSATSISIGTGEAVIPSTGLLENVASTLMLSSLSLTASTFYHVYLFDNAGTPTIECVTTAPATAYQGTARAKTGDNTRRYVGSVCTDPSGNILNFFHVLSAGTIRYKSFSNAPPFVVISGGVATSPTSISCSACVPITSRLMMATSRNSDPVSAVLLTTSDSGFTLSASNFSDNIPPGSGVSGYISLDTLQAFIYMYGAAPTGSFISRVSGYVFER